MKLVIGLFLFSILCVHSRGKESQISDEISIETRGRNLDSFLPIESKGNLLDSKSSIYIPKENPLIESEESSLNSESSIYIPYEKSHIESEESSFNSESPYEKSHIEDRNRIHTKSLNVKSLADREFLILLALKIKKPRESEKTNHYHYDPLKPKNKWSVKF